MEICTKLNGGVIYTSQLIVGNPFYIYFIEQSLLISPRITKLSILKHISVLDSKYFLFLSIYSTHI